MTRAIDEPFATAVLRHIEHLVDEGSDEAHSLEHAPLTGEQLAAAEVRLGFSIPSSLATLYLRIGNGGFGPAYGLLGLTGGALQEDDCDAVSMYDRFRTPEADDPTWHWPSELLPVVHLGCAMFFCVDCSTDDGKVIWFEPNAHQPGAPSWDDTLFPLQRSFRDLLIGWTRGEDPLEIFQQTTGGG